jgi:hypothetical protein
LPILFEINIREGGGNIVYALLRLRKSDDETAKFLRDRAETRRAMN